MSNGGLCTTTDVYCKGKEDSDGSRISGGHSTVGRKLGIRVAQCKDGITVMVVSLQACTVLINVQGSIY